MFEISKGERSLSFKEQKKNMSMSKKKRIEVTQIKLTKIVSIFKFKN